MNRPDFAELSRFVTYAQKRFKLPLLAGCFADARPQPQIPSRAVGLSLLLGEVVQIKGFRSLQAETQLPQWQRWVGHPRPISHDTLVMSASAWPQTDSAGRAFGSRDSSSGARRLNPIKSTGCWWSAWMPTNSFAATTGAVRIACTGK